jgi:hypothetical protein
VEEKESEEAPFPRTFFNELFILITFRFTLNTSDSKTSRKKGEAMRSGGIVRINLELCIARKERKS